MGVANLILVGWVVMAVVVGLGVVGCDGLGEKKEKKARNRNTANRFVIFLGWENTSNKFYF